MHIDSGPTQLNLAGSLSGNSSTSDAAPVLNLPYQYYQKLIIAHAVLVSLGFLILLPLGAILARYLRTFSPKWFFGHWIAQLGLGEESRFCLVCVIVTSWLANLIVMQLDLLFLPDSSSALKRSKRLVHRS